MTRLVRFPFTAVFLYLNFFVSTYSQEKAECFGCHEDQLLTTTKNGKLVSLFIDDKKFSKSIHGKLECISCHADLQGKELPHDVPVAPVQCGTCYDKAQNDYAQSLHGKSEAKGDKLAPKCYDCRNKHDILAVKDPKAQVRPINIPYVCGRCHQEGTSVQKQRNIPQDHILENYTESIHGKGLAKSGLTVI